MEGLSRVGLCLQSRFLIGLLMLTVLLFSFSVEILSLFLGLLYPAFQCLKQLESNTFETKKWLIYWIIFSFFQMVSPLIDTLFPYQILYWFKVRF